MNKILQRFNKLNNVQKVEFVLASLFTLALMVGMPVFAWFSSVNKMETMTKVKEPENLDIRAGHYHSIINFELSDINIEEMKKNGTAEYRVFSVSAGDYRYLIFYSWHIQRIFHSSIQYIMQQKLQQPERILFPISHSIKTPMILQQTELHITIR